MSLDNSIDQLSKLPLCCEHQLSTLCSNDYRVAMAIYHQVSIPDLVQRSPYIVQHMRRTYTILVQPLTQTKASYKPIITN